MIQGMVTSVAERPWNGKVLYNLRLNDGKVYGFGTTRPQVNSGDQVEFEATEKNGYMNAKNGTLRVVRKGSEQTVQGTPAAQVSYAASEGAGKNRYWENKEARDLLNDKLRNVGAARNTAIAFIDVLVKAGALKLPAKEAGKQEALTALLHELTDLFTKTDSVMPKTAPASNAAPAEEQEVETPAWE